MHRYRLPIKADPRRQMVTWTPRVKWPEVCACCLCETESTVGYRHIVPEAAGGEIRGSYRLCDRCKRHIDFRYWSLPLAIAMLIGGFYLLMAGMSNDLMDRGESFVATAMGVVLVGMTVAFSIWNFRMYQARKPSCAAFVPVETGVTFKTGKRSGLPYDSYFTIALASNEFNAQFERKNPFLARYKQKAEAKPEIPSSPGPATRALPEEHARDEPMSRTSHDVGAPLPLYSKDPAEAVSLLFDRAVRELPTMSAEQIKEAYEDCKWAWAAEKLHSGGKAEIALLLERNATRISRLDGFRNFKVFVIDDPKPCAALYGIVDQRSGSSISEPIGLWALGGTYYACGNSDFE